jgi:hypothetical protein
MIKRAIRGGSKHHLYAASYQQFDADIRWAEFYWWRATTFCKTWQQLIEYWPIMWTNSPFSKPAELQPTRKFCTPILLKSHFPTLPRYHTYFHITLTASLHFDNVTILFKQQQATTAT